MNSVKMTVVRIYLMGANHPMKVIRDYLKEEAKVIGLTIFRAVDGFGLHGQSHASWVDLSLEGPLVIEFMDQDDKVHAAMAHVSQWVKPEHMLWWSVHANRGL